MEQNMSGERIPRIAHIVWVGNNPMPALAEKCVASVKQWLPDYEVMVWDNERSREVFEKYPYARVAFYNGFYAFASDVIRLYALRKFGGVYFDTDMELFKTLDPYLNHAFFTGFMNPNKLLTGLLGSEKGGEVVERFLREYENMPFVKKGGGFDFTPNTTRLTDLLIKKGLVIEDRDQLLPGNIGIYRREIFCPYDPAFGGEVTENTVSQHHYMTSWGDARDKHKKERRKQRDRKRMLWIGLLLIVALALYFSF